VGALSLALGGAGVGIVALTPELATLEDLFFRLTEGGNGATPPSHEGELPLARDGERGLEEATSR